MKLLMLCREPRLYSCQRLKAAAEQRGHQLDILDPNRFLLKLVQGKFVAYYQHGEVFDKSRPALEAVVGYEAILPRFGITSTEMGCYVTQHFEGQGLAVLNTSQSIRLARNKWQSLQRLVASHLPVPATLLAGELCATHQVVAQFSPPVIIKTLAGSQGVGVMLSEHSRSTASLLDTLKMVNQKSVVQQFVREAQGQDLRAFVIGDQVVAAMVRHGAEGEFRANIHQGGWAESVQLTATQQQLAIQATQAIGLEVAGVDLIQSDQGTMVLEVNASPGLEMIEKVSGVDIATAMICQLEQHCNL